MINHRQNQTPWWRRLLRSRLMISVNLLLIGFIGWSIFREANQTGRVAADYQDLEKQINSLEKDNQDYSDVISRLGTPGFVEREARIKLSYQKPGEQVLILKDAHASAVRLADAGDEASLSNPQKWWRYFFEDK